MTELEKVYDSADRNYRESLRMLGDSILLVQDFVDSTSGQPISWRPRRSP